MDQDNLIFINQPINLQSLKIGSWFKHDFSDSFYFHKILLKHKTKPNKHKKIYIYDITYNTSLPFNELIPVNDHINRIGKNPFIGKQNFFKIDFINIENLYLYTPRGITTNSCGSKYDQHKTHISNPSTHLANIAVIGHIHDYQIQAYLVNQYIKE